MTAAARKVAAPSSPTHLYRCFNSTGELLYVGVSNSAVARFAEHRRSDWSKAAAQIKVELFPSREAALVVELAAIRNEKPRFNVVGVPKPRQSRGTKQFTLRLAPDVAEHISARAKASQCSLAFALTQIVRAKAAREECAKKRKTP